MRFKHIVFDLDGTLLNSSNVLLLSLQETLKIIQNRVYLLRELQFSLGLSGYDVLRQLHIQELELADTIWDKCFEKYRNQVELFPGISELFITLKELGYELGIVTSKSRLDYINEFEIFEIHRLIKCSVCLEDSPEAKPSPLPILSYLNKVKILPEEMIFIGDSIYDFKCAQSAHVSFGLALWGDYGDVETNADYLLYEPQDILKILGEKNECWNCV